MVAYVEFDLFTKIMYFLCSGYDVNWEDETDTISCLYKLSHKAASEDVSGNLI